MLTPLNLAAAFKNFCAGRNCDECPIYSLRKACLSRSSSLDTYIHCDTVWFVYSFLEGRGLLHKNPNDLRELLVEDDLQKLVSSIASMWDSTMTIGYSSGATLRNPFDTINQYCCGSCSQQRESVTIIKLHVDYILH